MIIIEFLCFNLLFIMTTFHPMSYNHQQFLLHTSNLSKFKQNKKKRKIKPFICIHISLNILQKNKYNVQQCFQSEVNYYTLTIFLYHRYITYFHFFDWVNLAFFFLKSQRSLANLCFYSIPICIRELSFFNFSESKFLIFRCSASCLLPSLMAFSAT